MDGFRNCPICLEVPSGEIFQCYKGHTICHLCISQVIGGRCPQCRVPFGRNKIRNRALEEILDSQDFDCKFKEEGCQHSCKRGEITSHIDSCIFNPDKVPLCEMFINKTCTFRFGSVSRDEIISHFETVHGYNVYTVTRERWFRLQQGKYLRPRTKTVGAPNESINVLSFLFTFVEPESPLFYIYGQINHGLDVLSVGCIKVWDSGIATSTKFSVEFQLTREPVLNQPKLTSQPPSTGGNNAYTFPLTGSMMVSGVHEARQTLEATPVIFPIEVLKKSWFGEGRWDFLQAKISEIPI